LLLLWQQKNVPLMNLIAALAQLLLLLFIVVRWPCTCAAEKTRESGSLFFGTCDDRKNDTRPVEKE
jgi:hypothetical protein